MLNDVRIFEYEPNDIKKRQVEEATHKRINDIDNGEILNQIARLVHLDVKFDEVYIMSPEEIEAVEEGMRQIENGQWISHEESNRQIEEWFKAQS